MCLEAGQLIKVQGNGITPTNSEIVYRLDSCRKHAENPDEDCESEESIDAMNSSIKIEVIYLNYYFDTSDYENPVKASLERKKYAFLVGMKMQSEYTISKNVVQLEDSWLGTSYSEQTYYSIERQDDFFTSGNSSLLKLIINESSDSHTFERKVTTIWDVLSDFGGILEISVYFVTFCVSYFQQLNFESSLISRIFYTEGQEEKLKTSRPLISQVTDHCILTGRELNSYKFLKLQDQLKNEKVDIMAFSKIRLKLLRR